MPKDTTKFELTTSVADAIEIPCVGCRRSTKHRVLASADLTGVDWYGNNSVQYSVSHQICQCQGCETITFRKISSNSEDFDQDDDGDIFHPETVDLYPSRNEGRSELKDSHLLPSNVRRIYEETFKAMNNNQGVLAGIGIRALIETVCKDRNAAGPNLGAKIDSLVKLGVLTLEGATILHEDVPLTVEGLSRWQK